MTRNLIALFVAFISTTVVAQPPQGSGGPADPQPTELRPIDARRARLANQTTRLSLKAAFMVGAINYVGNYARVAEVRDRDTGETRLRVVDEWQDSLAVEPQAGIDLFIGIHKNGGLAQTSVGYEAIVTTSHTSLIHRHMLAVRLGSAFFSVSGGAGLLVWNHYKALESVLGVSAFFELSVPFGRNGWFVAAPITFEWFVGTDLTAASGSLAIGWANY